MSTAILITLIMIVIFGAIGTVVFIMIKKLDPKNKDNSENPNIREAQESPFILSLCANTH